MSIPNKPGVYCLKKLNQVIYVGSAKNLLERYKDWISNPENPCVKRNGWDIFEWLPTSTHDEARRLELEWYNLFQPICNIVTPPGKSYN